ncbi:MAG: hypothetical protein ACUVRA_04160 [Candidatus Bathyarchaeaceae archaeon]
MNSTAYDNPEPLGGIPDEGENPVYALVFGDEEERSEYYGLNDWRGYASIQIEQADDALASNFGIDIRILDFLPWDSNDNEHELCYLIDEFEEEGHYLDTFYRGIFWSAYVDILIGVTNQRVTDAAGRAFLDGRITLVNWYCWDNPLTDLQWMDDNVIRHEISHLFGAEDHEVECGVMATGHEHFVGIVIEDGSMYLVCENVICGYITDHWCEDCYAVIWANRQKFSSSPYNYVDYGTGGEEIPIDRLGIIAPYLALSSALTIIFITVKRKGRKY